MSLPQETTTIEEFIESGKSVSVDYMDLSFLDKVSNGTWVSVLNVVNDYMTELKNACVTVELSEAQQWAYFYKPKVLCYDIYGNPELYFIILLLNDMADVKEFTKPKTALKKYTKFREGYTDLPYTPCPAHTSLLIIKITH